MSTSVVEKAPHITSTLTGAKEDLENAEFPGFVGKVFNPVRDEILVPVTSKATEIIPVVADAIPLPYVDEVGAFTMGIPIGAAKIGYSMIPQKDVDKEADETVGREFTLAFHKTRKPKPIMSSLMGVIGFTANSAIDLATLPFGNKFGEWMDATKKFLGFLAFTGFGKELADAFGDINALENMLIIARVQAERDLTGFAQSRRARTAMSNLPYGVDQAKFKEIIAYSSRYVKFASAAYGVSMIESAELLQVYNQKVITVPLLAGSSEKARVKKTCKYLGLKPEDIVKMTNPGGKKDLVNHFIAVDKPRGQLKGAVVLAIRGTYTLSGVKTDAALYSEAFCNGRAHAGIAEAANNLWKDVKDDIFRALLDNPGYDLVVTGHSLGAGTAALLTLKLRSEDILATENEYLKDVMVRCYAFAPPPVYYNDNKSDKIIEAMSEIYAFIHENDCVPFASADAVRRLSALMVKVDDYPKGPFGVPFSPLMAAGIKPVPSELKDIIFEDIELEEMNSAEKLAIPSPFVIWMRHVSEDDKGRKMYDTMFCRPEATGDFKGTNDLNFLLDDRMISDHMNPQYERAIFSVRQQMLNRKLKFDGYVFPKVNPEEEIN